MWKIDLARTEFTKMPWFSTQRTEWSIRSRDYLFVWCTQPSEKSVLVVGPLPVSVGDLLSDEPSKTRGPPPPSKGGSTVSRRSPSVFLPWESIFRMWVWVLSWAALVSKRHSRRLWRCYMKVSYLNSLVMRWIEIHSVSDVLLLLSNDGGLGSVILKFACLVA